MLVLGSVLYHKSCLILVGFWTCLFHSKTEEMLKPLGLVTNSQHSISEIVWMFFFKLFSTIKFIRVESGRLPEPCFHSSNITLRTFEYNLETLQVWTCFSYCGFFFKTHSNTTNTELTFPRKDPISFAGPSPNVWAFFRGPLRWDRFKSDSPRKCSLWPDI